MTQATLMQPLTRKAKVFIGSSTESLDTAYALQENLELEAEITVWSQGLFKPSKYVLDSLVGALDDFDFGIFVFGADDVVKLRGAKQQAPRDNVVFELGLFTGKLGRERNFLVIPRKHENFRLPTELLGMIPVTFDPERQDGNLVASLGPASIKILKEIRTRGPVNAQVAPVMIPSSHTPDSPLLNQLIDSAIQTVCRAVSLPQSPEEVKLRVFIFRKEANQLVCSHYWAPNPIKEMVGKLRFDITPDIAQDVAVVRALLNEEITRTKVSPLPQAIERKSGRVSDDLSFVLAAPILGANGTVWGTVDFDASSAAAEAFLSTEVSDATMFQLAQHLRIIFSLPSKDDGSSRSHISRSRV